MNKRQKQAFEKIIKLSKDNGLLAVNNDGILVIVHPDIQQGEIKRICNIKKVYHQPHALS